MSLKEEIAQWQEVGTRPIRPENPAGDPVLYDPDFEQIQAEVSKLENPTGLPVDWKQVVLLGRRILLEQSKDLRVGSYLCRGLLDRQGYTGLAASLACLEAMLKVYWETLYPEKKRMRGRIGALTWLSDVVGGAVSRTVPSSGETSVIQACLVQVESIEQWMNEALGNESPGLGTLRRSLQNLLASCPTSNPDTPPESSPLNRVADAPMAPAITEISSESDARKAIEEATSLLRHAASFLQSQDPLDPWPYRMNRVLAWMEITTLPDHQDNTTRISPPPERLFMQYQELVDKGEWAALLVQVEDQIQEYPFWLDLQQYSVLAMSRLGATYEQAKEAVLGELYTLLRRLPDLPDLTFSEGVPFANQKTRTWIARELFSSEKQGSTSGGGERLTTEDDHRSRLIQVRQEADCFAGKGQVKEAVGLFCQLMDTVTSQRERFLARLELAKFCLENGHVRHAIAQLQALDQELSRYSLEEWDPALSFEVLKILWTSLNQLLNQADEVSPDFACQADAVYGRLCKLNPVVALNIKK